MKRYTIVQERHGGLVFEALYSDGRLIRQADDGALTAFDVLDAIATDNITVGAAFVEVTEAYGLRVLAEDGWPATLAEIPEEARR